ncbi:MAG: replicative DNA helicase [Cryomorphaceae bacterium]|nr:replicative DNA helicase [Cryomorphaceae bacterium]
MEYAEKQPRKIEKSKNAQVIGLSEGRVPPQAVDMEEAVIGGLLIDRNAINEVIEILEPQAFYKEAHADIFEAIKELFADSQPIDIFTVADYLKKNGKLKQVGGEYYLVHLSQRVASSAHIEFHARVIVEKFILRELIRVSGEIITDSFKDETDVLNLLDQAEQNLYEIANGTLKKNYDTSADLVRQAIKEIEEMSKKEGLSGVPSGFAAVDKITGGWQKSDMIIIAARPGMGKTALTLSMARNMAIDYNIPVAFFSLEMSSVQLIKRLISSETGLSSEKLRKGNLSDSEWQQLVTKVKKLEQAPLFIDDTPAISVFDLRAKCRRLASQYQIGVIVVDYLQLMTAGGSKGAGNREQEISMISRSLKGIAKELNVPVIALSQVNRSVEGRGNASKRPQLSDLRESGAIEQDADIVSFIYRPEYYGLVDWEDGSPCEGQAELVIAKHRNGSLEDVRLRFQGSLAKFSDLDFSPDEMTIPSKLNEGTNEFDDNDFTSGGGLPYGDNPDF